MKYSKTCSHGWREPSFCGVIRCYAVTANVTARSSSLDKDHSSKFEKHRAKTLTRIPKTFENIGRLF